MENRRKRMAMLNRVWQCGVRNGKFLMSLALVGLADLLVIGQAFAANQITEDGTYKFRLTGSTSDTSSLHYSRGSVSVVVPAASKVSVRTAKDFVGGSNYAGTSGADISPDAGSSVVWDKTQNVEYNVHVKSRKGWTATYEVVFSVSVTYAYMVDFDATGGSGCPAAKTVGAKMTMSSVTPPTLDGYEFLGFYTERNGGGTQYFDATGRCVERWKESSGRTLYAHWRSSVRVVPQNLCANTSIARPGEAVNFAYDVKNTGSAVAPAGRVRRYLDGVEIEGHEVPALKGGESRSFAYELKNGFNAEGNHWFRVDTANGTSQVTVRVPQLDVKVLSLVLDAETGRGSLEVRANTAWQVSPVSERWLTVSPTGGSADATLTLTAARNASTSSRSATFRISDAYGHSRLVTVRQDALSAPEAPVLVASRGTSASQVDLSWTPTLHALSYNVYRSEAATGGRVMIATVADTKYSDAEVLPNKPYYYWVEAVNEVHATVGNGRVGYVPSNLSASDQTLVSPAVGRMGHIAVTCNSEWCATVEDDWIELFDVSGRGDGQFGYLVRENTTDSSRSGAIVLHSGMSQRRILVEQAGRVELFAESGTLSINTDGVPSMRLADGRSFSGSVSDGVAVFTFDYLKIGSGVSLMVSGSRPLKLESHTDMTIETDVDVSGRETGRCGGGVGGMGGAGGARASGGDGGGWASGGSGGRAVTLNEVNDVRWSQYQVVSWLRGSDGSDGKSGRGGSSNPGQDGRPAKLAFGATSCASGGGGAAAGMPGIGGTQGGAHGGGGVPTFSRWSTSLAISFDGMFTMNGGVGAAGLGGSAGGLGGDARDGEGGMSGVNSAKLASSLQLCGGAGGGGGGGGGSGGSGGGGASGGGGGGGSGMLDQCKYGGTVFMNHVGLSGGNGQPGGVGGTGGAGGAGGNGGNGGGCVVLAAKGVLTCKGKIDISAGAANCTGAGGDDGGAGRDGTGSTAAEYSFAYSGLPSAGNGGAGGRGGNGGKGGAGGRGGYGAPGMVKLYGSEIDMQLAVVAADNGDGDTADGRCGTVTYLSCMSDSRLASRRPRFSHRVLEGACCDVGGLLVPSAYDASVKVPPVSPLRGIYAGASGILDTSRPQTKGIEDEGVELRSERLTLKRLENFFEGFDQLFIEKVVDDDGHEAIRIAGRAVSLGRMARGDVWTACVPKGTTISLDIEEMTVTFDAAGGSCQESSRRCFTSLSIGSLPRPSKADSLFAGWFTQRAGGTPVDASAVLGRSQTLYAHWVELVDLSALEDPVPQIPYDPVLGASRRFAILYMSGAGSVGTSRQEVPAGSVTTLSQCPFTPLSGKRFAGWACSNGRRYDDGMLVFDLAKPGETVTMTAIWE